MTANANPIQARKNKDIQNLKKISKMADELRVLVEDEMYFPDPDDLYNATPDKLAEWLDDALINFDGQRPNQAFHRHLGYILEHVSFCHGLKFFAFWRKAYANPLDGDVNFSDHPAIDKECCKKVQEILTICETQLRAELHKRDKAIYAEEHP